jgi:RHS repeat-associated protein
VVWRADSTAQVPVYSLSGKLAYTADNRPGTGTTEIYLAGSVVAESVKSWGATPVTTVTYLHTDALGSPVARTNASRALVESTEYAPYGAPINRPVDGVGYTGHVMDQSSGLIYMQQRYYDPQSGRFLSVDPALSEFSRYSYASNNPYRFTDPDGRVAIGNGSAKNRSGRNGGMDFTMAGQSGVGATGEVTGSTPVPSLEVSEIKVARDLQPTNQQDINSVKKQLTQIIGDGQLNLKKSTTGIQLTFNILSTPTRKTVGSRMDREGRKAQINFNALYSLRVSNLRQPPRLLMFHELMHVYDFFVNGMSPAFDGDSSRDNAFVIPREKAYAQKLNVVFRNGHDEGDLIRYGQDD